MFGIRRTPEENAVDWPSLIALLEDDDRRAAVEVIAPVDRRESFLTSLRRMNPELADEVCAAGRQLHSASALVRRPTVAVAGMLNSGKTSLVSSFLSPVGRRRTLRGTGNNQGTHRFVLWLPEAWKNDVELWGLLLSRIADALGHPPEMLSDEPDVAHQQYNNQVGDSEALAVPLVATDRALNDAGIGLLDCPDIVSDAELGLGSPEERREFLGKAATLCSAFLVVTSAESSRDSNLSDVLRLAGDLMPGVPRLLAVNKVRPRQSPEQVLETFSGVAEKYGVETVYAAYDFDVPKSRPFIPKVDSGGVGEDRAPVAPMLHDDSRKGAHGSTDQIRATSELKDDSLGESDIHPIFYSVEKDPEQNPPAMIASDRLLSALPNRLDHASLFKAFQASLQARLRSVVVDQGLADLRRGADESIDVARSARQCLLDVTLDFFAHRDIGGDVMELRLHQNERIIRQLSEAFARTSPWYARWGVRLNATLRRVFGGVRDFFRQLAPTAIARRAADEVKDKFRRGEFGGLLSSAKLAKSIEHHRGRVTLSHWSGETAFEDVAETVINRFEQDDFTALDEARLHAAAEQMWAEVPRHKKLASGLTPLLALLATLGGVLMIPIDFGANLVAFASISELFAAAGLTTLSAIWAGQKSMQDVGQQAALQQVADFHAVLCDGFGVPRYETAPNEVGASPPVLKVGKSKLSLVQPNIVQRNTEGSTLTVYHVREEFRTELLRQLS
ncbi:MAG: hypothetical protein AAF989_00335 [Planctomycetota bacterium]